MKKMKWCVLKFKSREHVLSLKYAALNVSHVITVITVWTIAWYLWQDMFFFFFCNNSFCIYLMLLMF